MGCYSLLSVPLYQCKQCGVELQNNKSICGQCQINPPSYSCVDFACEYKAPIDKWVMSLKFGKNIIITRLFAELLAKKLNNLSKVDETYELMPVPLHINRLRSRGYNQAYEIAKELSKLSTRKLNTSLIRQKNTAMQAELKLKERAKNVKGAFKVKADITGKNIILIDDVMTSGNTLKECAKTLVKAGVQNIQVLVFSRKSLN